MNITKFSYDRNQDFKKSSDKLFDVIEQFSEENILDSFFNHYENRYLIPKDVLKQNMKKNIANKFLYKSNKFSDILKLKSIPISLMKNIGFLFLSLFYSSNNMKRKKYKLIIDEIDHDNYLIRFSSLIDLFDKKDVLIFANDKIDQSRFSNYNIRKVNLFKNHNFIDVLKTIYHEFFWGMRICLIASLKLKINLFSESKAIITTFLKYNNLFKLNNADFLFQERLYTTNPIKNYLFKKHGGKATSTMQKSILELCQMSYYIDIDYFFSLGKVTAERAFEYGGRIDKVIPVGSYFMEKNLQNRISQKEKNIDVLMLGINTMNAYERLDKYTEFMNDYYESIRWLVKFKNEYPSYRIGIKHHSSAGNDIIENKIILDSGIEIFPKEQNSYELAFESRCIVTWGSTMGYEMNGHGVPSFFIDPGKRNTFLYDLRNKKFQYLLLDNYDDYQNYLVSTISGLVNKDYEVDLSKNLCLDSHNVSKEIYKTFCN